MKQLSFLLVFICSTALATGGSFKVTGSQIGSDEGDAIMRATDAAQSEADRRCGGQAQLVSGPTDCQGYYSSHGQSETCNFEFRCL